VMATKSERAILAGGCFWGMQQLIRRRPGVLSTRVGYSGGDVPNATYRNHPPRQRPRHELPFRNLLHE
jgi:peptide-methionine (S)-S-oxide reductase